VRLRPPVNPHPSVSGSKRAGNSLTTKFRHSTPRIFFYYYRQFEGRLPGWKWTGRPKTPPVPDARADHGRGNPTLTSSSSRWIGSNDSWRVPRKTSSHLETQLARAAKCMLRARDHSGLSYDPAVDVESGSGIDSASYGRVSSISLASAIRPAFLSSVIPASRSWKRRRSSGALPDDSLS